MKPRRESRQLTMIIQFILKTIFKILETTQNGNLGFKVNSDAEYRRKEIIEEKQKWGKGLEYQ